MHMRQECVALTQLKGSSELEMYKSKESYKMNKKCVLNIYSLDCKTPFSHSQLNDMKRKKEDIRGKVSVACDRTGKKQ